MHQFREKSPAQRELVSAGLLLYPVLQAADVLAYRADEVPVGEDQREHLELMRDLARRFNARFGAGEEILKVPEHRIPEVGARIMDLQEPTRKMSTTLSSGQGIVYVLDEPDAILKKLRSAVTDSGSEIVRGPEKPGISNLIEILAAVRGQDPAAVEAEFAARPLRGLQDRRGRGGDRVPGADPRALRRAARRRGPARGDPRRGGPARARDRPRDARRRALGDGRGRASGARPRRGVAGARYGARMSVSSAAGVRALDLDLEVFSGPFDLLLTLVLREEVDLLELELAEVVLAYLDHLERSGELDLESATEFILLVAALLELKSRLMLTGEDEQLLDIEPGEAAEELLARMLDARRYRAAGEHLKSLLARRARGALPDGPLAAGAAPHAAAARPTAPRTRTCWALRSGGCWRCRRRSTCATSPCRGSASASACITCASCCAGAASASRRRSAGPTA